MTLTGLILGGGIGRRFWPLTTSKPLFPFLGQPLIAHIAADLKAAGVDQIIVVASPDNQSQIQALLPQAKTVVQDKPLGMADAILKAGSLLTGPTLIVNGGDYLEPQGLQALVDHISTSQPPALFTALETSEFLTGGYFKLDQDKLTGIIEKPQPGHQPGSLFRLVADYFADPQILFKVLDKFKSHPEDGYEKSLNQVIKDQTVDLYRFTGKFYQLKYPWQVLDLTRFFLISRLQPQIDPTAVVHPTAVVDDNVVLSSGVKVLPHATVKGPSFIGPDTIIGNNALVRESMIAGKCMVGYNTEIARSWIGETCWFHTNYIGDSVLESDVSFGAGALTANFRIDQASIGSQINGQKLDTGRTKLGTIIGTHVRVGVNTSLMPGIKLGAHSIVGPGLVLNQDLPDQKTAFGEVKLTLR